MTAAFTACDNGTKSTTETETPKPTTPTTLAPTTVSFVSLGTLPGTTINFSPSAALPAGVTYTVKDNRPTPNTWNSASSFTGVVNVTTYNLSDTNVTFTQTFYLNGAKITSAGSERTVVINVDDFPSSRFMSIISDTGAVTLQYPNTPLTKTITIPAINGVTTSVSTFSFEQTYNPPTGGWDTDFPSTALTYTLTAEGASPNDTATSISVVGRADGLYLVTQTFYYNGTPIQGGSRSIALEVLANNFVDSYISKTDFSVINAPVPALNNLTLTK
jgi:hypothetical protein